MVSRWLSDGFIWLLHLGDYFIKGILYLPTASGWEASGHYFLVFPIIADSSINQIFKDYWLCSRNDFKKRPCCATTLDYLEVRPARFKLEENRDSGIQSFKSVRIRSCVPDTAPWHRIHADMARFSMIRRLCYGYGRYNLGPDSFKQFEYSAWLS